MRDVTCRASRYGDVSTGLDVDLRLLESSSCVLCRLKTN
ncbi:hypothetical protein CFP56_013615 [Quercus suber]|uniref:Uncharacterized protein n=1 Tax=Quercus suber TaxID=58331 RepID=A0AAW0KW00_QUESU